MDNLRLVVYNLFAKRSLKLVIESFLNGGKRLDMDILKGEFEDFPLHGNSQYGIDSLRRIQKMTLNDWMFDSLRERRSVFNVLPCVGNAMLCTQGDDIACQFSQYLRWNELTMPLGENLFTTSYLASCDVRTHTLRRVFGWRPFLASDNKSVNSILEQGLSETHFHLEGSSLNFDINWISLMNRRFDPSMFDELPDVDNGTSVVCTALWASAARYALYSYLMGLKGSLVPRPDPDDVIRLFSSQSDAEAYACINNFYNKIRMARNRYGYRWHGDVIDYAIPSVLAVADATNEPNIPLIGERKLMYECFRKIFGGNSQFDSSGMPLMLYVYLLAKHQIRSAFVQQDRIKGFAYFDKFERRKDRFCPKDTVYDRLVPFMAVHTTLANQPIRKLEVRVAPKKKVSDLAESINRRNIVIGKRPLQSKIGEAQVGYVIHFIKTEESNQPACFLNDMCCRNYQTRMKIEREADAIATLIRRGKYLETETHTLKIVGIDAANSEFNARPEVFASVFRRLKHVSVECENDYLRNNRHHPLGFTFHVAEDFYDVVDGLRAIEECVLFLEFGNDNRIGHAVALGVDVGKYYRDRHRRVVMPKHILLDNVAWLIGKIDSGIPAQPGVRGRLMKLFSQYCNEIYGIVVEDAASITIDSYLRSWLLRGNAPRRTVDDCKSEDYFKPYLDSSLQEIKNAVEDRKACELFVAYHYSGKAKKSGDETVEMLVEEDMFPLIEQLQRKLLSEIARKGIIIESNPTSNIRITDVKRYDSHPILRFNSHGLGEVLPGRSVRTSLNTDDQGVFGTSLEKEYTLMAIALDKTGKYSSEQIYQWLENVRRMSNESSFLDG